ncbi:GH39 family glycosyl hydrolase [Murimonas intestini]|uniref:GH39 family glycosyl hydrolase n=1 Tax=Murimonas intestini TaxID=1337051 RepID=UPI00248D1F3E|nr:glycosyl hydrolase [Murimonas intestini]
MKKEYKIDETAACQFKNRAGYCVGTGRMGLALQKEYQEQLKLVQEHIGFKYIRGHGIFSDDMGIYQEYEDENGKIIPEYNFTYLDRVMDSYQEMKIKPFLELGFMPQKMAGGEQTVFYWRGNVTPPKSYKAWTDMVQAVLNHLIERYGRDEAVSWPIEVWNEPNLSIFWKDADMEEYFSLFRHTFRAVKEVDEQFQVGGPSICGVDDVNWLRQFLDYCSRNNLMPDFFTRHHYMWSDPVKEGRYSYGKLRDPQEAMEELKVSRTIIDSFRQYQNLPMYITEFNTSYSPDSPVHDSIQNASYVAWLLSRMGEVCDGYSYWTFGDVFEENGVPFSQFHGGFGLVANGAVPKPSFWVFAFFKNLQGRRVHLSDEAVVVQKEDGSYCGVAWNLSFGEHEPLDIELALPCKPGANFCFLQKLVDEEHGNPVKLWHDMGEPSNPSKDQLALLREGAAPWLLTKRLAEEEGYVTAALHLKQDAVVYFELRETEVCSDRGYHIISLNK